MVKLKKSFSLSKRMNREKSIIPVAGDNESERNGNWRETA